MDFLFLHALAFVFGFSLIFVIGWGGATTLLGQLFVTYKLWIARVGGLLLIIFGLATMNIIHIPWFYMDTRQQFKGNTGTLWGSLAMGIFFAAGWSPCIGATLGAILTLGFRYETVGQAMFLSLGYSLGLGIPFFTFSTRRRSSSTSCSTVAQVHADISSDRRIVDHRYRFTNDYCTDDGHRTLGTPIRSIPRFPIYRTNTKFDHRSSCWSVIFFIPLRFPISPGVLRIFKRTCDRCIPTRSVEKVNA